MHKAQHKVQGFLPPRDNLPFCSTAMNTNRGDVFSVRMVFKGSTQHLFLKHQVCLPLWLWSLGVNTLIYAPSINICGNSECLYLSHAVRFLWFWPQSLPPASTAWYPEWINLICACFYNPLVLFPQGKISSALLLTAGIYPHNISPIDMWLITLIQKAPLRNSRPFTSLN